MSRLTLVPEDFGSLAELQRVQKLLCWGYCYLGGFRTIKEKSFFWYLISERCTVSGALCQLVSYGSGWL